MTMNDLFRPGFDSLYDDTFKMTPDSVDVINTNSGKMLRVNGCFENTDGDFLEDSVLIAPDWKQGSVFRKLLESAECLPEKNKRLDPTALIGLTFLFTIKINSKNGREYPNVIDVALPSDEE